MKHKNQANHIIHALNNCLASISLSTELLLQEGYGVLNAKQKKSLKTMLAQGEKIKNLLKKLQEEK